MRWVRGHRRVGACVALFALALQLALSFGHIHLADIASPLASVAAAAPSQAEDYGGPANPDRRARDICAICATLNLTASADLPTVASLVVPFAFTQAQRPDFVSALISSELFFLFQARAPPVYV